MNGDFIATLEALRGNLPRLASDFDSVELAKGFFARLAVDVFTIYYRKSGEFAGFKFFEGDRGLSLLAGNSSCQRDGCHFCVKSEVNEV